MVIPYTPATSGKHGWCCPGLEHSFGQRRERGIFVFASPSNEYSIKPAFWIAMRAVTQDMVGARTFQSLPESSFITLATKTPIQYCPWCGVLLSKFYQKFYEKLLDESVAKEFGLAT